MVDATQFEELELYRDPNNSDRFIARDPSDDAIYAIPFEEIESTDATITNNLTVDGTTATDTLEAGDADVEDQLTANNMSISGADSPTEKFDYPASDFSKMGLHLNDASVVADNSGQVISDVGDGVTNSKIDHGVAYVFGAGENHFTDIVQVVRFQVQNVISAERPDGEVSRNYSFNSGELRISIDDNSNQYDIGVKYFGA